MCFWNYLKKTIMKILRKNFFITFILLIFLNSCGSWESVKRGMTNQKQKTTDEFLVKKKVKTNTDCNTGPFLRPTVMIQRIKFTADLALVCYHLKNTATCEINAFAPVWN